MLFKPDSVNSSCRNCPRKLISIDTNNVRLLYFYFLCFAWDIALHYVYGKVYYTTARIARNVRSMRRLFFYGCLTLCIITVTYRRTDIYIMLISLQHTFYVGGAFIKTGITPIRCL